MELNDKIFIRRLNNALMWPFKPFRTLHVLFKVRKLFVAFGLFSGEMQMTLHLTWFRCREFMRKKWTFSNFHAIRTLCMSFCMIKSNFYFCIIIRAGNHFQLRVTLKERLHSKMCYMWTLYFRLHQEFQHIAILFS